MSFFESENVDLETLKARAFNMRWAEVPEGVIPLTAADPDFKSAPEIAQAIIDYCKDPYFSYGPTEGLPEFKKQVALFFNTQRLAPVKCKHVLPVDSAAFGIYLVCKTFLQPNDEAIIFDPVDFLFGYSIGQLGAKAVPFPIPQQQAVDFHHLESLITPKTKMICLCNPLNPTGKVFTEEELLAFGAIAEKYDLTILSDEIWSDIVYAPATFVSISALSESIRNRTITVTGFSKSYGLAGLRIGAVIAHNDAHYERILDCSMYKSTVHGVSVPSQVGGIAALTHGGYWVQQFVAHTQRMRDLLVTEMNSIPGLSCIAPDGCYVAFIDIRKTNKSSVEIYNLLLEEAKVAVVPGLEKWFGKGAEGHIRICFSTSETILKEAISRIKKCLS